MDQDEFRGEIIFTFDADEAGRKAALRANAFDQQFVAQTFVAIAPDGLDPCDLRLQRGEAAVRDVVASRVPMFEFVIQAALGGYDLGTAEGRIAGRRAGMAVVRDIRDVALRSEYARRLAGWLGLDDPNELVAEARGGVAEARRGRGRVESPGQGALLSGPMPATPAAQVEREALKLALQRPGLAGPVFDSIDKSMFTVPAYAAVRELVLAAGGTATAVAGETWVAGLRDGAPDDAIRGLVTELAVEPLKTVNEDDPRYARAVLARLQELAFTRHAAELRGVLQRTNPEEQAADYNRLFAELIALDGRIKQLREEGLGGL
jgi:DNA primase